VLLKLGLDGEEEVDEAGLPGALRAAGPGVLRRVEVVIAGAGAAGAPAAAGLEGRLPWLWGGW
jgi:hypothetical protein